MLVLLSFIKQALMLLLITSSVTNIDGDDGNLTSAKWLMADG